MCEGPDSRLCGLFLREYRKTDDIHGKASTRQELKDIPLSTTQERNNQRRSPATWRISPISGFRRVDILAELKGETKRQESKVAPKRYMIRRGFGEAPRNGGIGDHLDEEKIGKPPPADKPKGV